jgi:hypothetical protein
VSSTVRRSSCFGAAWTSALTVVAAITSAKIAIRQALPFASSEGVAHSASGRSHCQLNLGVVMAIGTISSIA